MLKYTKVKKSPKGSALDKTTSEMRFQLDRWTPTGLKSRPDGSTAKPLAIMRQNGMLSAGTIKNRSGD